MKHINKKPSLDMLILYEKKLDFIFSMHAYDKFPQ